MWIFEISDSHLDARTRDIREAWNHTWSANPSATVFQSWEFVRSWMLTKGAALGYQPVLCSAKETHSGCEVLLPLVALPRASRSLWTTHYLVAGEPHFDYQDPLVSNIEAFREQRDLYWEALGNQLRVLRGVDRVSVFRLREGFGPTTANFDSAMRAPYIDLNGCNSLEDFLGRRSQNLRVDVRRRIRRSEQRGEVRLTVMGRDETSAAMDQLDEMVKAYEMLWHGQMSGNLFRRPGTLDWYRQLVSEALPSGLLHFSVLWINDLPISWHFGFLHRGILYWYKPTYRVEFSELSPGKVHLGYLIDQGCKEGWKEVDLGPGTEAYKLRWTDQFRNVYRWVWTADSPRQRMLSGARRLISWMGAVRGK